MVPYSRLRRSKRSSRSTVTLSSSSQLQNWVQPNIEILSSSAPRTDPNPNAQRMRSRVQAATYRWSNHGAYIGKDNLGRIETTPEPRIAVRLQTQGSGEVFAARSGDGELAGGAVLQSSGWRSRVEGGGDTAT